MTLPDFLYRFRSVNALLGEYRELELQTIYFSLPEALNDPMEGFKDIFWSGDEIVWRNLLKNYLLCLERVCLRYSTGGEARPLGIEHILVSRADYEDESFEQDMFKEACRRFFDGPLSEYPKYLASQGGPLRRDGLLVILTTVHRHALASIFATFQSRRCKGWEALAATDVSSSSRTIAGGRDLLASAVNVDADSAERLHAGAAAVLKANRLRLKYNHSDGSMSPNREFLWLDFPDLYLTALEALVHPRWSTACFVEHATNAAMWAHYADQHKGVCLKFRTTKTDDAASLRVTGVVGIGGNRKETRYINDVIDCAFRKVRYVDRYPEIDFFRTLGRLPYPTLDRCWYTDEAGKLSACASEILSKDPEWLNRYWTQHQEVVSTKLRAWSYEDEYRLVSNEVGISMLDPVRRTVTYSFSDLSGIIFGIKTPDKAKVEMMKIIAEKSRGEERSDFSFYQASYSRASGAIAIAELPMLRFRGSTR